MTGHTVAALVAYESLFGATGQIAKAIAAGLAQAGARVDCRSIREVDARALDTFDLLVLGAPTHSRSLPTPTSRAEGVRWLDYRMRGSILDARAAEPGLREWIADASLAGRRVAAFTTRAALPRLLSGSAARAISRLTRGRGARVQRPAFEALVTDRGLLLSDETGRALRWGRRLVVGSPAASRAPA